SRGVQPAISLIWPPTSTPSLLNTSSRGVLVKAGSVASTPSRLRPSIRMCISQVLASVLTKYLDMTWELPRRAYTVTEVELLEVEESEGSNCAREAWVAARPASAEATCAPAASAAAVAASASAGVGFSGSAAPAMAVA